MGNIEISPSTVKGGIRGDILIWNNGDYGKGVTVKPY
jgi:hypothetical protein